MNQTLAQNQEKYVNKINKTKSKATMMILQILFMISINLLIFKSKSTVRRLKAKIAKNYKTMLNFQIRIKFFL